MLRRSWPMWWFRVISPGLVNSSPDGRPHSHTEDITIMPTLTLGAKFRTGFLISLAVTAILGLTTLLSLRSLSALFDHATEKTAAKLELAGDVNSAEGDLYHAQRAMLLSAFTHDRDGVEKHRREFDTQLTGMKAGMDKLEAMLETEQGKRNMGLMKTALDQWLAAYPEVVRQAQSGNPAKANAISADKVNPAYLDFEDAAYKLSSQQRELLAQDSATAHAEYTKDLWLVIGLITLCAVVGGVMFLLIRQVNGQLRRIVGELAQGASQVAAAAGQISAGSQSLSQGASEQAAAVEQVSASLQEIGAAAQHNEADASAAVRMMGEAGAMVGRSNTALSQMQSSMTTIKESSQNVAKIIRTIDEIAFQTNILALNAAVEAARAGDAGKGFAVVAEEVRSLAQRAAAAAKDTAALIEESIGNSGQGAERLQQVSTAFGEISGHSTNVKGLIEQIDAAGKQQLQGIEQVSTAIQQVSTVTQTNASSAEESAAAAQELSAQSLTVRDLIGQLARMVDGGRSVPSDQPRPAGPRTHPPLTPAVSRPAKHEPDKFPMVHTGAGDFRSF